MLKHLSGERLSHDTESQQDKQRKLQLQMNKEKIIGAPEELKIVSSQVLSRWNKCSGPQSMQREVSKSQPTEQMERSRSGTSNSNMFEIQIVKRV